MRKALFIVVLVLVFFSLNPSEFQEEITWEAPFTESLNVESQEIDFSNIDLDLKVDCLSLYHAGSVMNDLTLAVVAAAPETRGEFNRYLANPTLGMPGEKYARRYMRAGEFLKFSFGGCMVFTDLLPKVFGITN